MFSKLLSLQNERIINSLWSMAARDVFNERSTNFRQLVGQEKRVFIKQNIEQFLVDFSK